MHNSLYVAYHFMSTCIVTMYTASRCCCLLLHAVQFTFVAARHPVCYLLPNATQFAICCRMPHGCCLLAPHAVRLLLVSYHLLLHAARFAIRCHVPCSCCWCCILCSLPLLPHSVQFNIHYHMPCSLLFVVAVCYWWPCAVQLLLVLHTVQVTSFATLHTVQYSLLHAMQFAICCCMPYSLLFIAMFHTIAIGAAYRAVCFCCRTPYSSIFIAACHAVCYLLSHVPYSLLFTAAICCHVPYSCYLLPHAIQLLCVNTCRIVCYLLPHAVQLLCVAAFCAATILWLHAV